MFQRVYATTVTGQTFSVRYVERFHFFHLLLLDYNKKTREKEDRLFRVVVFEKSTESIVDGEKDKHMDNREHQTGMDTGVKGAKGCIKLHQKPTNRPVRN